MKATVEKVFSYAGVQINGSKPWDIQVRNEDFYKKILSGGSLAFGESYMDKWWDTQALDELVCRLLRAQLDQRVTRTKDLIWNSLKSYLFNQQTKHKSKKVGGQHYDVGNDLYKYMLDKRMNYTCGYWRHAHNLDQAQEDKLELICQKLKLAPGMTMLDIGCGWGSLAKYAAEKYQVKVIGVTISKEQVALAQKLCEGLDVEIRLQDYRDVPEKFDRVVSVGMFEHVGYKNYRTYMEVVNRCMHDDGLFLLHTIGGNRSVTRTDPWIEKYIFPNSMLPSAKQITAAAEGLYCLRDWHNFGTDYDKTLMAWHKNFTRNWDKIKKNYSPRFQRMWNYYLLSCAGSFRAHSNQLWQIVFTKKWAPVEYRSIR